MIRGCHFFIHTHKPKNSLLAAAALLRNAAARAAAQRRRPCKPVRAVLPATLPL
jgi:hypothetical protein